MKGSGTYMSHLDYEYNGGCDFHILVKQFFFYNNQKSQVSIVCPNNLSCLVDEKS